MLLSSLDSTSRAVVDLVHARVDTEGNAAQSTSHSQNYCPGKCCFSWLLVHSRRDSFMTVGTVDDSRIVPVVSVCWDSRLWCHHHGLDVNLLWHGIGWLRDWSSYWNLLVIQLIGGWCPV